jgi:hypothetical protein
MNNRSAKGVRRFSLDEMFDKGAEGDFFIDDVKSMIWIHIPGSGLIRIPYGGATAETKWQWDGNEDAPTITPSINVIGQWHGWMRNGELISC